MAKLENIFRDFAGVEVARGLEKYNGKLEVKIQRNGIGIYKSSRSK